MKLDLTQWTQERLDVEQKIRALKNSIRHGGVREGFVLNPELRKYEPGPVSYASGMGTYRDYQDLYALQTRATVLYKIRAYTHGRQHLKGVERDYSNSEAQELLGMNPTLQVQELVAAAG